VCDGIWGKIAAADKFIQENVPFKLIKTDPEKGKAHIQYLLDEVFTIAVMLRSILPETSAKIIDALKKNKVESPLFLRKA
jgi:methionyl-tRNA synthetase